MATLDIKDTGLILSCDEGPPFNDSVLFSLCLDVAAGTLITILDITSKIVSKRGNIFAGLRLLTELCYRHCSVGLMGLHNGSIFLLCPCSRGCELPTRLCNFHDHQIFRLPYILSSPSPRPALES
jgi:hypothetical protein